MAISQQWLNNNYPLAERNNVTELLICNISQREEYEENPLTSYDDIDNRHKHYLSKNNSLTGTLDLSTFTNLKKLVVEKQFINRLILTNCSRLKEVRVGDNLLREIEWPSSSQNLEAIDLTNNNFSQQNLFCFSSFTRLRYLYLGTDDESRIQQGIYNRWNGSLVHLRNLTKLEDLTINATDIDSGLEFLPTRKLIHFVCGNKGKEDAGVNRIKEICGFNEDEAADEDINVNSEKIEEIREWQGNYQQAQIQANRN